MPWRPTEGAFVFLDSSSISFIGHYDAFSFLLCLPSLPFDYIGDIFLH